MSTGVRKAGRAALAAVIFFCLLAASSPHAEATFPGRPGSIVFNLKKFHTGGFSGGLFMLRPGKEPRQLTNNPTDHDPSFSPDGDRLVFRRTDTAKPGIYILNIRTGAAARVTSRESDLTPAFGPDRTVVFSRFVDGHSYDLFLRSSNGGLRRLTSSQESDQEPVFTPDGKRIIFSRSPGRITFSALGRGRKQPQAYGLYSIGIDGSKLKALGNVGKGGLGFDISPDGHRLLFFQVKGGGTPEEVRVEAWSQALYGGKPQLLSSNAMYPTYSPNGNKIAYSNQEGLWIRDASAGGSPTLLFGTNYLPYQEGGSFLVEPAWQPLPPR